MKQTPILFSAPMVRAILEGCKTQTRRVINAKRAGHCPYGAPGDRLWVRETWATVATYDHLKPSLIPKGDALWPVVYYAAYPEAAAWHSPNRGRVRPSIFMPRWASRITLEITGIRVERVQSIKTSDIVAEGVSPDESYLGSANRYRHPFVELWDSINYKRGYGWDQNPWVWVISFSLLPKGATP